MLILYITYPRGQRIEPITVSRTSISQGAHVKVKITEPRGSQRQRKLYIERKYPSRMTTVILERGVVVEVLLYLR